MTLLEKLAAEAIAKRRREEKRNQYGKKEQKIISNQGAKRAKIEQQKLEQLKKNREQEKTSLFKSLQSDFEQTTTDEKDKTSLESFTKDETDAKPRAKPELEYDDVHERIAAQNKKLGRVLTDEELSAVQVKLKTRKILEYEDLDPSQKQAIDVLVKNGRACLIGYAGTGKSTVVDVFVRRIYDLITTKPVAKLHFTNKDVPLNVTTKAIAFCAFTGRATQQLQSKLDEQYKRYNCMTIHKLLGYAPVDYECEISGKTKMRFEPSYNRLNKLEWEVIVIDEAGMMNGKLWNELIEAIHPTTKIYLVGDLAQLPSIHGVSPMTLLLSSWPYAELTKIHRTDEANLVDAAQDIRKGLYPKFDNKQSLMKTLSIYPDDAGNQILGAIASLYKQNKFDPEQDILITANNGEAVGQIYLNSQLRRLFNPDADTIEINAIKHICYYGIGDKVMSLKNDAELGVTNGMTGWVRDIQPNPAFKGRSTLTHDELLNADVSSLTSIIENKRNKDKAESESLQASHILTVEFPECYGSTPFVKLKSSGDLTALGHAYAITCHKAQGGEYRNVVIAMHNKAGRLLNREWFYTAWTRAIDKVYLLTTSTAINGALRKQAIKGKTLEEKAQFIIQNYEKKRNNEKLSDKVSEWFPKLIPSFKTKEGMKDA